MSDHDRDFATIADEVSALMTRIRSQRRRLSRAKNLLKKVDGKTPAPADYEDWLAVHRGLEGYEVGHSQVDELRQALVKGLGKVLQKLRIKARMKFLTKFEMLAEQQALEIEKISENPLVLYVDPFTFTIDFDQGGVEMAYGKELIEALPIDASTLLESHQQFALKIQDNLMDSPDFFELLYRAYSMVLAADGSQPGERVDLVDVLVPLSMLRVSRDRLRQKGAQAMTVFPRYLLARQLAELRRDGALENDGKRLELGAATGGSTRDKTNVLYVPVAAKGGQYYGSLRFE